MKCPTCGAVHKPMFTHDCESCVFLGAYEGRDLYYCDGIIPTVLARYSSDGPDYVSGMEFAATNNYLKEAKRRAILLGLIKEDDEWIMQRNPY